MPFQFSCTSCGQPIGAMEQQSGQAVSCPTCGAQQVVPFAQAQGQPPFGGQQPYAQQPSIGGQQPYGQQQFTPPFAAGPQPGGPGFQPGGAMPPGGYQAYDQYPPAASGGGSGLGARLGGVLGLILVLVILNVISYALDCGWVFY